MGAGPGTRTRFRAVRGLVALSFGTKEAAAFKGLDPRRIPHSTITDVFAGAPPWRVPKP